MLAATPVSCPGLETVETKKRGEQTPKTVYTLSFTTMGDKQ